MKSESSKKDGILFLLIAFTSVVFWGWLVWDSVVNLLKVDSAYSQTLIQLLALLFSSILFLVVVWLFARFGFRLMKSEEH